MNIYKMTESKLETNIEDVAAIARAATSLKIWFIITS